MKFLVAHWDRWSGRYANFVALFPQLIPSLLIALATGKLASVTTYLKTWGPFGWWGLALGSGIVTYIAIGLGRYLFATAAVQRMQVKILDKIDNTNRINPLLTKFENERFFAADIGSLTQYPVTDKYFENCEIIGPTPIVFSGCGFTGKMSFHNVEFIRLEGSVLRTWPNKLIITKSRFHDCTFINILMLINPGESAFDRFQSNDDMPLWL